MAINSGWDNACGATGRLMNPSLISNCPPFSNVSWGLAKLVKKLRSSVPFYCYILECADGTYYTGWTTDPERRLKQHNKGTGSRYTRNRLPVKVVYLEPQPDRSTAMKRERAIKRLSRERKRKLILS
jgi:putative endonuclease